MDTARTVSLDRQLELGVDENEQEDGKRGHYTLTGTKRENGDKFKDFSVLVL